MGSAKRRRRELRFRRRLLERGVVLLRTFKVASTLNVKAKEFIPKSATPGRPMKSRNVQVSSGESSARTRGGRGAVVQDPEAWLLERARTFPFTHSGGMDLRMWDAFVRIIRGKLKEYGVPPMEQCDGLLKNLAREFEAMWASEHPEPVGLQGYQTLLRQTRRERARRDGLDKDLW